MKLTSLSTLTITAAAALLAHTAANAAETVAEQNIAAIYQPALRAATTRADTHGVTSPEAVSLLDGIVRDWRDPSRDARKRAPSARQPAAAGEGGNVALEKLRDVYAASSAD